VSPMAKRNPTKTYQHSIFRLQEWGLCSGEKLMREIHFRENMLAG
jgi:hypothetical protein